MGHDQFLERWFMLTPAVFVRNSTWVGKDPSAHWGTLDLVFGSGLEGRWEQVEENSKISH